MPNHTNLRILIIDDNPKIHTDFIKILTASPPPKDDLSKFEKQIFGSESPEIITLPEFHIDTASQGQEGVAMIEKAAKEGQPYALAFVDIRMPPGWDGIETIKRIWKLDQDIQIVICTAYSDYTWEETVQQLGQRENLLVLKKPFDNVAVRQLSCALTKKWQLMQEVREYTKSLEQRVEERTSSLKQALSVTRGTLESSEDGIIVTNSENNVINYNNKMVEMFAISEHILKLKDANILFEYISTQVEKPEDFLKIIKNLSAQLTTTEMYRLKSKNEKIVELHSQPYKSDVKVIGRVWSFRDVTKRALLEEKIQHQATHDILTGLPNRALLTDHIQQAIAIAKRDNSIFGLLFFDLDRFKLINDSFSHACGDQLLQAIAKRIKFKMREMDTFARLGGDEFVGVITAIKNEVILAEIATKLLAVFSEPIKIMDHEIIVTASIGISIYPRDGKNVDELLRSADTAMYRAKELGGNQFQFYTSHLNKQSLVRLEIEADLHRAIKNKEFFLCYQPQFNLLTNKLISVEALVRWEHPKKGVILPIDFIPIAEETGLITTIGENILRAACQQNKNWQNIGLPKIRIAVNITTRQFKQPNLVMMIKNILQETNLAAEYLELELTENVILGGIEYIQAISELKKMGVNIALDDFGTGYSCLNYLRKIPLDRLKIDQSFIQNININRGDEVIIQAIITMANSLHLEVLAEGVETQKQLDFLKSKRCGEIQGFYFSKPLSSQELESLLRA